MAKIPAFPDSRPLELGDMQAFDRAFAADPPVISEFTFANIYSWRQAYAFAVSCLDDFLIVRSTREAKTVFFPPIGTGDIKKIVVHALKSVPSSFIRVPDSVKSLFTDDPLIKAEPDINNADYLYRAKDLILLAGKKYDGKRNLIRKFKSVYHYEYIRLEPSTVNSCFDFEEAWCRLKDCDAYEGLRNERWALSEMVNNFQLFGLLGGAIKVENKVCAVALGSKLNADTMVLHILKADPSLAGLYQVMNNEFLIREGGGLEYVNMEQDLGIQGLRKAKLSYHPVRLINKFTLNLL